MTHLPIEPPTCGPDAIWEAMFAPYHFPTLLVADEIGLFAWLHEAPARCDEVAERYGMSQHAATALLGVLASKGHLVQHLGRFHLTESSRQFLLPASAYYCGPALGIRRHRPINHVVLKDILFRDRVDEPPVLFDTEMWEASAAHVERHRASTASMHALFFPAAMAIALYGDFRGVRRLLDVAGGSGAFSIALAARYPEMQLTVMDLPPACVLAAEYAKQYGVADRVATMTADMFHSDWPADFDAHFFSNVFHDWNEERNQALATRSFETLPAGGRIYVHESLLNETLDGPPLMALYSMNMARVTEHGRRSFRVRIAADSAEGGIHRRPCDAHLLDLFAPDSPQALSAPGRKWPQRPRIRVHRSGPARRSNRPAVAMVANSRGKPVPPDGTWLKPQ